MEQRTMAWLRMTAFAAMVALVAAACVVQPAQAGEDGIGCSLCQDAIVDVENFLEANSTVQDIIKALDDVCKLLSGDAKQKCLQEVQHLAPKLAEADDSITTKYSPFALCSMLGQCQIDCCATPYLPEQIHLSITTDISEMVVMWSTLKATPHPVVQYGLSSDNLNMTANATTASYTSGGWQGHLYTATMTGLRPKTTYYYRVGDPTVAPDYWMKPAWSQVPSLHFTTRTAPAATTPLTVAMIGDAGATDASMLSLAHITQRVVDKSIDFLFHDGDIGYADGYQTLWDAYVRKIESIAGFVPYMTVQGNHEGFYDFKPYMARFAMPWKQSKSQSPLYYSFDYGSAHFIAVNSESEFGLAARTVKKDDPMYKWLEQDLQAANASRHVTPWIVVVLHRPLYCTESNRDCKQYAETLREGLEDLFFNYNVDVVIQAHRHNYQASYPVYQQKKMSDSFHKPPAPVYIVNGAAGNKEHLMGPGKQDWARVTLKQYGYATLSIANSSLDWTYYAAADNAVLDHFTITK
ncbi:hypothetical protein PTSG_07301 [Salpingoeca rosetta]|uniref:Purple acid phosphatase n=1 Tax=Salpingoeca rosetta (strain ATCC 50818 / BSB-021) TaxID=946362 RepID=F2UJ11_SALR5|nr:uncharacterized protein PTSG_07301 [Salpingoeca rosetta]EGD76959.1 hypothetical protein PTSG_07301 [Salpingoeca rosetta]|eukprot:XP_004990799.1 hypothetical protein PTSG_07301 [Salpingoeca rosetta]